MNKKNRPILTPPIQRVTIPYFLTRFLVKKGVSRFHRITTIENFDKLPNKRDPRIFVSNHQNGMMDPMIISGLIKHQLHWLTRSDVFWKPLIRKLLYSYNQMPIYRHRDKFTDIRERNSIIWNCCVERLEIGAALSLFPEGNHNPKKTIRDIKRGLGDLLGIAINKHPNLKRVKIIPLGLDYEDYPGYKRRLSLRMGDAIEWNDLINKETGVIDFNILSNRVQSALRKLTSDIRPKAYYDELLPFVRAMRTTEAKNDAWLSKSAELNRIAKKGESSEWLEDVSAACKKLKESGFTEEMRPEAWGTEECEKRQKKIWTKVLLPIAYLGNLPTALQQYLLNRRGDRLKAMEFRSTLKVGAGIFIYPISWTILASIAGWMAYLNGVSFFGVSPFFEVFIAFWSWATFGNKFYGWFQEHIHDHRDAIEGEQFWCSEKKSTLRNAWIEYIAVMKKQ